MMLESRGLRGSAPIRWDVRKWMAMRAVILLAIWAMTAMAAGCDVFRSEYAIRVRKSTPALINSVAIQFGEYRSQFGYVGIHKTATHTGILELLPQTAQIEWKSSNG